MQSFIAIVLVLGGLIFFHELGHYLAARALGIGVRTFSLGFGPKIFSFFVGPTRYCLAAVPLGGYVQLVGEDTDEDPPAGFSENSHFMRRPPLHRMLVVAAGPVFNFVLAWVIYFGLFLAHGQMELAPNVGTIKPDSPAMHAGIETGDVVTNIDGTEIVFWQDLVDAIAASQGGAISITVRRDGSLKTFSVTPEMGERSNIFGEKSRTPLIGIMASGDTINVPLTSGSAAGAAVGQTWDITVLIAQSVVKIFERIVPIESVGGPIMIAQMVSEQAKVGISNLLALTALISINLGMLNLLPIPVLDGGHLMFLGFEMVMRKPVSIRVRELTTKVGFALLITLMALALYNDIARLFQAPA